MESYLLPKGNEKLGKWFVADTHSGVAEILQLIVDNRLKQHFFWIQCLHFSGQSLSFIDYPGYVIGMCFVQELCGEILSCLPFIVFM